MKPVPGGSTQTFEAVIPLEASGRMGHTIRILPADRRQGSLVHDGFIHWAS
jgi:hypothetical protein